MRSPQSVKSTPPSSRSTTEDALLDALETVLERDGLRQLSVNAVVEAAGVGKPLLYRYFGDLQGLVQAWGKRRGFWAEVADTGPPSRHKADEQSFRQQISDELVAGAEHLRAHPVTLEFLAEELTATSDLSAAFAEARDDCRRPFLETMLGDPRYLRRDNRRVIVIIHAALTYLAMRSRRSPNFMGLRLDTEAGWRDVLDMARELSRLPGKQGS
ncbi:MAG: helix-turn-helix domain-containing protein [Gammaproteobacteria bacterium]